MRGRANDLPALVRRVVHAHVERLLAQRVALLAIPHEDVVRFDANAIKKLAGMSVWFASQKEPLARLLDGELKLLPELDAEIDRLGAQYGTRRVEESARGAFARLVRHKEKEFYG